MTIITAFADAGDIWVGFNDQCTLGDTPLPHGDKWLDLGGWAIGVSGASSQADAIARGRKAVELSSSDPFEFTAALQEILDEHENYIRGGDDVSRKYGIWSIIAHRSGVIWDLDSCLALTKIPKRTIWARGSGCDYALGAGHVLSFLDMPPEERVRRVTEAAIACDVTCPGKAVVRRLFIGT